MNNMEIQKKVYDELEWDPSVNSCEIGVAVKDEGVITLSGTVSSYLDKKAVEEAAKRVSEVKVIADDIKVTPSGIHLLSDTEIAENIAQIFKRSLSVPSQLKVKVENGNVTLEGKVHWEYQKKSAKNALRYLYGVRSITNAITIEPKIKPHDIRLRIKNALGRLANIEADKIKIESSGGTVTLSGKVFSFAESKEVKAAAWRAPGVQKVIDHLFIEPQVRPKN